MRPKLTRVDIYSKRKQIAHDAIPLFARYGFRNTKISEIAKAAKVSIGQIYLCFQDKEDILRFIFDETWREINEHIKQQILPSQIDSWEKIKAIVDFVIGFFHERLDLAKILIRETYRYSDRRRPPGSQVLGFIGLVDELLMKAKKEGKLKKWVNVQALRHAIYGAVEQLLFGWYQSKHYPSCHVTYDIENVRQLISSILIALSESQERQIR